MTTRRSTRSSIRPYLTTNEVLSLSGMSRKALRYLMSRGIAASFNSESNDYYGRWTYGQALDLRLIQILRDTGTSTSEIGKIIGSTRRLAAAAYDAEAKRIRADRRALKAITHDKRRLDNAVGTIDGFYLRYIPQRWFALIPVAIGSLQPLSVDKYNELLIELMRIIDVVGWSPTYADAHIASINASSDQTTMYIGLELASPPMPRIPNHRIVDAGCYRVFDETFAPECSGKECDRCARFGRKPTKTELSRWRSIEVVAERIDRSVMLGEGPLPRSGIWSELDAPISGGKPRPKPPAFRPSIMPQVVRLPLGVTACTLPAGVYLCRQCDYDDEALTMQRTFGTIAAIPQHEVTAQDEDEAVAQWRANGRCEEQDSEGGPFVEPFATARGYEDPVLSGLTIPLELSDLPSLEVPTRMAFAPEDGYLMVLARTAAPGDSQKTVERQEVETLVDPRNIPAFAKYLKLRR